MRPLLIPKVELLVGQNATVPMTLHLAQVAEALTVTAESPLVDTSSSQVAGNVDRRQMESLPLQGRNWMELSKMVKGITANDVSSNRPGVDTDDMFQLNLDGQQITQKTAGSGFGQPKFSRESIAEFQIVTTMFDITQGRSAGIEVQAISKSGTNTNAGSFYGYFRSDKFNAPDPVADVVLPVFEPADWRHASAVPIVKDKLHYFASYEYEREPGTVVTSPSQLPGQTFTNSFKDGAAERAWPRRRSAVGGQPALGAGLALELGEPVHPRCRPASVAGVDSEQGVDATCSAPGRRSTAAAAPSRK